jgi:hypothetical protein
VIEPSDGGIDVPLVPVRPAGGDRRQARAVLVAGLALAAVALGLAALSRADDDRVAAGALDEVAAASSATASAGAAAASPGTSAAPTSRRNEGLQQFANRRFAGAPRSILVRRTGDDAELLAWRPGDDTLQSIRRFPGALTGMGDGGLVVRLAPDARSLLILTVGAPSGEGQDRARLVTADGGIAWVSDAVTGLGGSVWSSDSRALAVSGADGRWWLVTIDASGATPRKVPVGGEALSTPEPTGMRTDRLVPIGFSENGRWVYGAKIDPYRGSVEPAMRVEVADGTVEQISTLDLTGPDRLEHGVRGILDPTSGRTVGYGPNASIPGGPPMVEVKGRDGTVAFRVAGGVVLGTAWTEDGRLLVLDTDGVQGSVRLRVVGTDGVVEATVLDTGPAARGGLIGVTEGFVALAFTTDRPDKALQIVVVRLEDGARSAIVVQSDARILGSGLTR